MATVKVGQILTNNQNCEYKVIEHKNSRHVRIQFLDEHKHELVTTDWKAKMGSIENPFHRSVRGKGYLGVGEFSGKIGSYGRHAYLKWQGVLARCYGEKYDTGSYADATVCEDWHDFQKFAEWCSSQKNYDMGFDIDKDIINIGNKHYSPENCCLVHPEINRMVIDFSLVDIRKNMGLQYDEKRRKYRAMASVGGYKKHIGTFKDFDEAKAAYIELKKQYFKNMVIVHKDNIDMRAAKSLWSWKES